MILNADRFEDLFIQCLYVGGVVTAEVATPVSSGDNPAICILVQPSTPWKLLSLGRRALGADPDLAGAAPRAPNFHLVA